MTWESTHWLGKRIASANAVVCSSITLRYDKNSIKE